jgi:hypothetical protein
MKNFFVMAVFSLLMISSGNGAADSFNLPVQLDYSLIKKALITQLYTGAENTAELWNDKQGCSFLKLSDPKINGQNGLIRLLNKVQAKFGTAIGGQCLTVLQWDGVLETLQQPTLNAVHTVLSLPVTQASAYDQQGRRLTIDKLQDLIKRIAEPKLAAVKIDLNESRSDIEHTVAQFLPKENEADLKKILDTLKFTSAEAKDEGVLIKLGFTASSKIAARRPAAAFTDVEQKQWQAVWQEWDVFLSKAIKQASNDAKSEELRDTLTEILLESRNAFQAGLKERDANAEDPVRKFFTTTWQRLAPILRTLAKELPEVQGLRYLTFIAATDVIYELENIGAPFGLDISSDGLRRLARILMAGKQEQTTTL